MKRYVGKIVYGSLALLLVAGTMTSYAQQGGGRRGQGFGGNPEQMRQMIMQRFQEQFKATDDEWKVIQPLIEKVWDLQRETRMGGMGRGFFRPMGGPGGGGPGGGGGGQDGGGPGGPPPEGGPGGGGPGGPPEGGQGGGGRFPGFGGEQSPEVEALQQVVDSDTASADDIKAKLTALRDARKKKQAELESAQTNLKKVLSVRQEAIAVLMGLFE